MADFEKLSVAVHSAVEGFSQGCMDALSANKRMLADLVREQMYAGLDGKGDFLSPSYDNDPYFSEDGPWKGRSQSYKKWKEKITPPIDSYLMHLPPRPISVPNLFITGSFYDSIHVSVRDDTVDIVSSGFVDGDDIINKYGDDILFPGYNARLYLKENVLLPWLHRYFKERRLL